MRTGNKKIEWIKLTLIKNTERFGIAAELAIHVCYPKTKFTEYEFERQRFNCKSEN